MKTIRKGFAGKGWNYEAGGGGWDGAEKAGPNKRSEEVDLLPDGEKSAI
jgi:hypothetical protein